MTDETNRPPALQRPPAYDYGPASRGPSAGTIIGIVFAVLGLGLGVARCGMRMSRDGQAFGGYSSSSYIDPYASSPTYGRRPTVLALPGMSVKAPDDVGISGDYATGSVRGTAPGFWISWQRGTLPATDELRDLVDRIAKTLEGQLGTRLVVGPHRTIRVGTGYGVALEIATSDGTLYMTLIECDQRIVQLMTAGSRTAMDTMVETFVCTPIRRTR